MFTGIVEATGAIAGMTPYGEDLTLTICAPDFDFTDCALGDSIAVNGVCLTVTNFPENDSFSADVSVETLQLTTLGERGIGDNVNLERALTLSTPLGGHLVSGHVDGVGEVLARETDARSERFTFQTPAELAKYIAKKGSITIDGVSLTVNQIEGCQFQVNIVPHTLEKTTLGNYFAGTRVNLEVDLLARYLERLLQPQTEISKPSGGLSEARLKALGY